MAGIHSSRFFPFNPRCRHHDLKPAFGRATSIQILENEVLARIWVVVGILGFGKSIAQAAIAEAYLKNHPDVVGGGKYRVCVSNSLAELIEPLRNPGDIRLLILVHDDPLGDAWSRGGQSKEEEQRLKDYEMMRHLMESDAQAMADAIGEAEAERGHTLLIVFIAGPQDMGLYERVFRSSSMHVLFKTPPADTRSEALMLEQLYGDRSLVEALRARADPFVLDADRTQMSFTVGRIGFSQVGTLWLGPPPPEIMRKYKPGGEYWISRKEEEKSGIDHERIEVMTNAIMADARGFDFQYCTVGSKAEKAQVKNIKQWLMDNKGIRSPKEALALAREVQERIQYRLNTDEYATKPTPPAPAAASAGSPLYEPVLDIIRNDGTVFKNATSKGNAVAVLSAYMAHWKRNAALPVEDRHNPTYEEIAHETGLSGSTVGEVMRKVPEIFESGKPFEQIVQRHLQRTKAQDGEIFAREGECGPANVHEPDILSDKGRVFGCKWKFGNPRSSADKTASFTIDSKKGFRPEMDACIKGAVSTERFGNGREVVKVGKTFTVAFGALGWGDFITLVEVDPREHKVVKFRYDSLGVGFVEPRDGGESRKEAAMPKEPDPLEYWHVAGGWQKSTTPALKAAYVDKEDYLALYLEHPQKLGPSWTKIPGYVQNKITWKKIAKKKVYIIQDGDGEKQLIQFGKTKIDRNKLDIEANFKSVFYNKNDGYPLAFEVGPKKGKKGPSVWVTIAPVITVDDGGDAEVKVKSDMPDTFDPTTATVGQVLERLGKCEKPGPFEVGSFRLVLIELAQNINPEFAEWKVDVDGTVTLHDGTKTTLKNAALTLHGIMSDIRHGVTK